MTNAEIKAKVDAALKAYEEIPFRELIVELGRKIGTRRALAYRPALVSANQVLRFIADDLARPGYNLIDSNQPTNEQTPSKQIVKAGATPRKG